MKNIIIHISTALLFVSCGNDASTKEETNTEIETATVILTDAQYNNASIQTGEPEMQFISHTIRANGKTDVPPKNQVSISVQMGGYVKSTRLMPGMPVRKGEVLAVMEDQQYIQLQQDYLTAKAKFAYNEAEYKRQKELNENKAASDKTLEQSKANYQTEYVLIKALEEKLKLIGLDPQKITADNISRSINIQSPIDGFVSSVNVNTGKYVNPNDVLFELVNPNDIHLVLTVFEKDIDKLAVGQQLTAQTNNDPNKKYACSILLINRHLSNENSVQVLCKFEEKTNELLPGMFMSAEIHLSGNEVSALPNDAVVRYGNKQYIFIETGNKRYDMKEVLTGSSENGFTETLNREELKNEKIVITGAYTLLMALKNVSEDQGKE